MDKKKVVVSILITIIIICTSFIQADCVEYSNDDNKNVLTEEDVGNIKKAYTQNDESLQELYSYIDGIKMESGALENLKPEEYIKNYIVNGKGNLDFDTIVNAALSMVFNDAAKVLKFGISIIVIAILCSLLKNLQDSFASKGVSEIAFYACYTILIIVITRSFLVSIQVAKDVLSNISNFMNALLPILVSLTALSGGVIEASAIDPVVMGVTLIVPRIYCDIIIPLILITFTLEFVNNLSSEQKINSLCKMVKKITMWIQGIIITSAIAIVAIRGVASNTLDAVTLKTTKFAVDNFIPIVGKSFSDAITSVASYSLVIKNAVSAIGLLVIVLILLYPVIQMVLMIFIYKFSASVIEPISDKRIVNAVGGTGECMVLLLSSVLTLSLMCFILIGVMASTSRFVMVS